MTTPYLITTASLVLAALAVGLWLGERGRRQAAERWRVYGTPEAPPPAGPAREAGESPAAPAFTEEEVERGAAQLEAMMVAEGFRHTKQEYRDMAREMLADALRR